MKAIHNKPFPVVSYNSTVFIPTKIQNESNSQPPAGVSAVSSYCIYPYKDTK